MSPAQGATVLSADQRQTLLSRAKSVLGQAYAPYSKFHVGAAILTEAGNIYTGVNVENASYGMTNCAERTAIFTAITAEGPSMKVKAIAVWSDPECACSPCGACRQVIWQFGQDALVLYQGKDGVEEKTARELLPGGFVL